jgi:hypothetical protein
VLQRLRRQMLDGLDGIPECGACILGGTGAGWL